MNASAIRSALLDNHHAAVCLETALSSMVTAQLAATHADSRFDFDSAAAPLHAAVKNINASNRALRAQLETLGDDIYDRTMAEFSAILAEAAK